MRARLEESWTVESWGIDCQHLLYQDLSWKDGKLLLRIYVNVQLLYINLGRKHGNDGLVPSQIVFDVISKLLLSSSNIPKFEAKDIHPSLINYNMQRARSLVAFVLLALSSSFASAFDPSPLQDFCVAIKDPKDGVFVNGKFCRDPILATANDFSFSGLNIPGNTSNKVGSNVTLVNVDKIPGLNTLGISLARIDFAPYGGLNPPHTHPRATEILVVLEGTLYVGFVTSNPNRLITKVLNAGDVFVFPIGLIHFQFNIGQTNAVAISGLSSQNPGVITIANAVFGSNPPINPDVLTKAFQVDKNVVNYLQKQFWVINH
ncbi:hypothetical protein GH714_033514 [Hevea brasiliensis]|uniref:Cupin type-1 domain-containing protein n=1 Tax=Hevea brasiliensis TaxID=3981 RepID=A0A6A6L6H3_HEVBR|nr:hypothetical protein GH714_033514 [Hevea brasiliensis]